MVRCGTMGSSEDSGEVLETLRIYYPWPRCPSVSISGTRCALNCRHCNRHYLSHMVQASSPDRLLSEAEKLRKRGAYGLLISGGCDSRGRMLNLKKMLPVMRELRENGMLIKLHTGFVDRKIAEEIAESIDIASMEMVGDESTIKEIFRLPASPDTYVETFRNLADAGVRYIAPHIAVGLHYGILKGEFRALELLKETIAPSTISIITFRPTKGTELENLKPPEPRAVGDVVKRARELFPGTNIVLGCMRPRGSERNDAAKLARVDIETAALEAGIQGIEIPSNILLERAREKGYRLKEIQAFGVLPIEMENRVECRML